MAIDPIPVTFQIRADPRAEPGDAPRRQIRPYANIMQAVGVVALVGVLFGFMAGSFSPAPRSSVASAPAPASGKAQATAAANLPAASFPVARPAQQAQGASVRQIPTTTASAGAGAGTGGGDPTPVATIAGSEPRPRAFPPAERAPDYSGFRITAGR